MSIDNEKLVKWLNILNDFLAFKINVFPIIARFLYGLSIVWCIIWGIILIANGTPVIGILTILLGPIFFHLMFELALLFFSMLDLLRDIRNELRDKKE